MSTVDDSKTFYYSGWDIDQLVATGSVTVPSGVTAIFTFPAGLPPLPVFEVLFRLSSLSRFYQAGYFSTDGTVENSHSFSSYISGNQLFINTSDAGIAKYYVWSDKVDY